MYIYIDSTPWKAIIGMALRAIKTEAIVIVILIDLICSFKVEPFLVMAGNFYGHPLSTGCNVCTHVYIHMYIYNIYTVYICLCHLHEYALIVFVVKEVGGLGHLMGVACKRTHARATPYRPTGRKLHAHRNSNYNSCSIRNIFLRSFKK